MNALTAGHDAAVQMIDTSVVRVHQHGACIAGNSEQLMGRWRGGLTTKIHAVVDTSGPVRLALTTGEAHDNRLVLILLSALKSGAMLMADRGFDADWIRTFVSEHGAWANIPPRRNRTEPICFSPYLYRARNLVERFFNKIKHRRRVATRYAKLAANYLAFIQLASIRLWLRVDESAPYIKGRAKKFAIPVWPSVVQLCSAVAAGSLGLAIRCVLPFRSNRLIIYEDAVKPEPRRSTASLLPREDPLP
jgi:transposase